MVLYYDIHGATVSKQHYSLHPASDIPYTHAHADTRANEHGHRYANVNTYAYADTYAHTYIHPSKHNDTNDYAYTNTNAGMVQVV